MIVDPLLEPNYGFIEALFLLCNLVFKSVKRFSHEMVDSLLSLLHLVKEGFLRNKLLNFIFEIGQPLLSLRLELFVLQANFR